MGKKIALFGGSFDPIHIGHIQLALDIKEHFHLDKVLFCPAYLSPFKTEERGEVEAFHRLNMVKLAIEGIEGFSSLDFEVANQKISYTVDTLRFLKSQYPKESLYLILGEDVFENFFEWKEPKAILEMATILIGSRELASKKSKKHDEIFEKGFCRIHNMEISATYLRQRLQKKLYSSHLIPSKVLDYIHKHGLYSLQ